MGPRMGDNGAPLTCCTWIVPVKEINFVVWPLQAMENLPQIAITITLSFSKVEDVVRCACVARAWASCVHSEPIASKVPGEN